MMMNFNELDGILDYPRATNHSPVHSSTRGWSPLHFGSQHQLQKHGAVSSAPNSPILPSFGHSNQLLHHNQQQQLNSPFAGIHSAPSSPISRGRTAGLFDDEIEKRSSGGGSGGVNTHRLSINTAIARPNQQYNNEYEYAFSSATATSTRDFVEYDDFLSGRPLSSLKVDSPTTAAGNSNRWNNNSKSTKYASTLTQIQQWFHSLNTEESASALQSILYTYPYPSQMQDILEEFLLQNTQMKQPSRGGGVGVIGQRDMETMNSNNSSQIFGTRPQAAYANAAQKAVKPSLTPPPNLSFPQQPHSTMNSFPKLHAPKPRAPGASPKYPQSSPVVKTPPPTPTGRKSEKGRIPDQIDLALLEDVPAWLRSLRLHKYNNVFWPEDGEGHRYTWKEMINLSDEQLEELGVGALGARRKLLKVFELVHAQLSGKEISYSSGTQTPIVTDEE